ncbi:MAG: helical backbone metal receptor [Ignavibacteria bacterium]
MKSFLVLLSLSENFKTSILIFLLSPLVLYSCSGKSQIQNPKFQIRDDAGVEITFDSIPKRIISLAPNITETLFAIDADPQVVGVTDLCDFPPEVNNKTKTGSYISPNYEVMVSLNPDLIIMNVENTSNPTYQALKNMNMKVYVSNAKDIEGIYKMISDFGKMTGKKSEADSLDKYLHTEEMKYATKKNYRAKSLILISVNPLMTTNGKTFINDIIEMAPLMNMYGGEALDYPNVSYEDVIKKDPDIIVFPTDTNDVAKSVKFTDEIKRQLINTSAVKNNKIILVDENIMYRPGPRVFEAVRIVNDKYMNETK